MKKVLAILLAAVFTVLCMPAPAVAETTAGDIIAQGFASGHGTEDDPYIIETYGQLCFFRDTVNSGYSFEGEYIALGNDIKSDEYSEPFELYRQDSNWQFVLDNDIGSYILYNNTYENGNNRIKLQRSWAPIGGRCARINGREYVNLGDITTESLLENPQQYSEAEDLGYVCFSGSFDGRNHNIEGLFGANPIVYKSNSGEEFNKAYKAIRTYTSYGLFGCVKNGTVKNVTVITPIEHSFPVCDTVDGGVVDNVDRTDARTHSVEDENPKDYALIITVKNGSLVKNITREPNSWYTYVVRSLSDSTISNCRDKISSNDLIKSAHNCTAEKIDYKNHIVFDISGDCYFSECTSTSKYSSGTIAYKASSEDTHLYFDNCLLYGNGWTCTVESDNHYYPDGDYFTTGMFFGERLHQQYEYYMPHVNIPPSNTKNCVVYGNNDFHNGYSYFYQKEYIVSTYVYLFGIGSEIENCYFSIPPKKDDYLGSVILKTKTAKNLEPEEMAKYESYSGLDFLNIWRIEDGEIKLRFVANDPTLYGDADGDGSVTPLDALYMRQMLAEGSDCISTEADMRRDGALTPMDVLYLRKSFASGIPYVK